MKKTVLILVLTMAIGLNSFGQFYFGVSPGLTSNSANFGYKVGNLVPYAALQVVGGSMVDKYSDHYWDDWAGEWIDDVGNRSTSINLFLPTIGVKYFAIESNDLKAYGKLALSKAFVSGKLDDNGTAIE